MGRKSERSKSKKEEKSPKHSASRSGRGRRRKKSQSDSDEEQPPPQSESRGVRKSRRGQAESTSAATQGESSAQADWKEDESFWQTNPPAAENKEGSEDTVWKVQSSNGSGGEIQKLRICRQRPVGGSASDSAESSMSPHKDTTQSPKHTRSLRRDNQKSPLVDSVSTDVDQAVDHSAEPLQSNEASEFTLPLVGQPVVEYVYETQPNFMSIREASPIRLPVSPDQVISQMEDEPVLEITTMDDERLDDTLQQPEEKNVDSKSGDKKNSDKAISDKSTPIDNDDKKPAESSIAKPLHTTEKSPGSESLVKEARSKSDSRREAVNKPQSKEQNIVEKESEKRRSSLEESDKRRSSVEDKQSEDKRRTSEDTESKENRRISVDSEPKERRRSSVEDKDSKEKRRISVDSELKDKPKENVDVKENRRLKSDERRNSDDTEPKEKPSENQEENKSTVILKSSVDNKDNNAAEEKLRVSADLNEPSDKDSTETDKCRPNADMSHVEGNESVVETTADADTTKEEGEIVDESPASVKQRRLIKFNSTASVESKPAKITINRRSTPGEPLVASTPQGTTGASTTGSSQTATTAKKHPLITGPEPDEPPVARRRKLSATLSSSTRTLVTPTGTTRQVRSIPGQALKAVLQPEPDLKKEKRIKLVKSHKEEIESPDKPAERVSRLSADSKSLADSKAADVKPTRAEVKDNKVEQVEDVREIIKNNRDKKLSETVSSSSHRKVHIGPLDESVSAVKPARASSPGDSKATSVLFISNLVRPFTAGQLKELLSRTGTIADNGFFIDRIKSKAFVKYVDVEMAIETRHALNGVKWPISNPKTLKVAYASDKDLKQVQDSADGEVVEHLHAKTSGSWLSSEQPLSEPREKRKSGSNLREWDRGKDMDVIYVDQYSSKADRQVAALEERLRDRRDGRDKHSERERRKRRTSSERIQEASPPPARKFKKKDYDAPAKLLDDLFRKTKATPCLYWLPLSKEQIAVKEEARRKHMAEAERRMSELKKSAEMRRERERDRRRK